MRPYDLTIDTERIKAAIWRMKPNRGPGPDGITAKMLRQSLHILGEDITDLFRRCMDVAVFPKAWKTGRLVLIPKAGKLDRLNPKSYRPVSLLNALSKALETVIIQDIESETDLSSHDKQHGFVVGRSTVTAIREICVWTDNTKSRHVIGAFLDITGAFDNVSWPPMLKMLLKLGASVRTLGWFKTTCSKER